MSAPSRHSQPCNNKGTPITPTGLVPASAYRLFEETISLLSTFNVMQVKMVVIREDGSFLESVLELHEFTPHLLQGFQVGEHWVYPDPEKAFFNPFFKQGAVLSIPCIRQEQMFHQIQQQQQQQQQLQQQQTKEEEPAHEAQEQDAAAAIAQEDEEAAIAEMMVLNSQGVLFNSTSSGAESSSGSSKTNQALVRYESPSEGDAQYLSMQPLMKIPKKGTSCHQCKNTKHLQQLAFCTNAFLRFGSKEKRARSCRKKFCRVCLGNKAAFSTSLTHCFPFLAKFYQEELLTVLHDVSWKCPSCRGECVCAACVRTRSREGEDVGGGGGVGGVVGAEDCCYDDCASGSGGEGSPVDSYPQQQQPQLPVFYG
eukprot:TRINITY_DN1471_c0_g1_i4.p1 TRINITY_DN1471_c0_g1~~TRINITY_DN1471_c0_g1_i4.p1  ORF type:complete len:368 (-),score=102.52 TRINITY_DN1471_c0_g1_i4:167-1270(-)